MATDTALAPPVLPARGWRRVLCGLFGVSGISGLLYEVAWMRMLHLLFGDTVLATSTVLTAFMAGLALGSWWSGRRIDRRPQVLGVYAGLELGIGLSAVLLPLALQGITPLYVWLHRQFHTTFVLLSLVRFCLAFALLLIPTTLMGATLPVLSRYIVRTNTTLGWSVGVLYALNTGGAVLGCGAAGYVLIGSLGLYQTVALGAALNLGIALVVWIGRRWAEDCRPVDPGSAAAPGPHTQGALAYSARVDENLAELAWFADDVTPLLVFNGDYTPEQQQTIKARVALQHRISRYIFRGYLANWRRQLQEGTREYRKALKLDPHDEGIKFALGIAARHKQQALAALERQPQDIKALSKLGYIAWNEQQYDAALQRFQQVLAIDPRQAAAYVHLGANYIAQERFAEATAAYLRAGRLNPEYLRLVEQSLDLIQHLQRAHERPDDSSGYLQLGAIYASDGRSDRAIEMFEKAVALAPSFVTGWLNLALNYEAEARDAEAMDAYRRVLTLEPDNPVAQNNSEKLALKTALARHAPARLTLASDQVLDVDPDQASGYYQLGLRYLRNNEAEAAAAALEQALRLQPDHDAAPMFLGMAYTALRASAKAEAAYRRAIALAPQNAQAYNYLGLVYQQQQRYNQAVKAHQRAIDLAPAYAVAYANLAASYEALGKIKPALLAYDQALQHDASLEFVRDKITALRKQGVR